jgi:phage terminase large subunit-like protein
MQIYEGKEQIEQLSRLNTSRPAYFVGLDLGQAQDFSAIAVMEMHGLTKDTYKFNCRHLQRRKLINSL